MLWRVRDLGVSFRRQEVAVLVETRTLGFGPTDAIVGHVESRMDAALAPFSSLVKKIMIRLEDVNAGRGGTDKRCSVVVTLRRRGVVVAEAIHADLYAAIDEAASRIRRSVRRAARRRLRRERRDPQRPGALLALS